MVDFIKTQNNFSRGEIAPEFFARDDIAGVAKLENMDVLSGGGLSRRAGLSSVATLSDVVRIIPFSVGEDENYILVIGDYRATIMGTDGSVVQNHCSKTLRIL